MACVFNGKCVQSKQAPVSFFMAACRWCQSLTICVCTAAFHYTVHALKLNMLYILCVVRILLLWLTWLTLETWDFVFGKYLLVICAWVMFFFFLYESCGLFSSRNQKVYTFQLIFHVFAASMLHNSCPAAHCCCTVEAAFLCHQGGASLCNWHTSPEPTRSVSTLPSDWLHGPSSPSNWFLTGRTHFLLCFKCGSDQVWPSFSSFSPGSVWPTHTDANVFHMWLWGHLHSPAWHYTIKQGMWKCRPRKVIHSGLFI